MSRALRVGRCAPFRRRALAWLVDCAAVALGIWAALRLGLLRLPPSPYDWIDQLALLTGPGWTAVRTPIRWLFVTIFTASTLSRAAWGGTPGERLLGLRHLDRLGRRPGVLRAAARAALGLCQWAPAGAGFFWAILDRERQTWADRLAGTRLIHGRLEAAPMATPLGRVDAHTDLPL